MLTRHFGRRGSSRGTSGLSVLLFLDRAAYARLLRCQQDMKSSSPSMDDSAMSTEQWREESLGRLWCVFGGERGMEREISGAIQTKPSLH